MLILEGTGVILGLAVDADDNLIFSMNNDEADTSTVYFLAMNSQGMPSSGSLASTATTTTVEDGLRGDSFEPHEGLGSSNDEANNSISGAAATGSGVSIEAAVPLGGEMADLGSFVPGVAVCPVTGDVYVALGHNGLTRMLRSHDFETQVFEKEGGGQRHRRSTIRTVQAFRSRNMYYSIIIVEASLLPVSFRIRCQRHLH